MSAKIKLSFEGQRPWKVGELRHLNLFGSLKRKRNKVN